MISIKSPKQKVLRSAIWRSNFEVVSRPFRIPFCQKEKNHLYKTLISFLHEKLAYIFSREVPNVWPFISCLAVLSSNSTIFETISYLGKVQLETWYSKTIPIFKLQKFSIALVLVWSLYSFLKWEKFVVSLLGITPRREFHINEDWIYMLGCIEIIAFVQRSIFFEGCRCIVRVRQKHSQVVFQSSFIYRNICPSICCNFHRRNFHGPKYSSRFETIFYPQTWSLVSRS